MPWGHIGEEVEREVMDRAVAAILDRLKGQYKTPIPARLLDGLLTTSKEQSEKVLSFLLVSQPGVQDGQFLNAIISKGFEIDEDLVEVAVGDSPVRGQIVVCCGLEPSQLAADSTVVRTFPLSELREDSSKKRLFWEEVKKVKSSLRLKPL